MSWLSQYAFWKARRLALVPPDTTPKPTIASATGTTTVIITGTGFLSTRPSDLGTNFVLNVYFGLVLATSFTVDSATQITAVGSYTAGVDAVVVNTSGGCATLFGAGGASFHILTELGAVLDTEAAGQMRTE